jgi:hypothetical protein
MKGMFQEMIDTQSSLSEQSKKVTTGFINELSQVNSDSYDSISQNILEVKSARHNSAKLLSDQIMTTKSLGMELVDEIVENKNRVASSIEIVFNTAGNKRKDLEDCVSSVSDNISTAVKKGIFLNLIYRLLSILSYLFQ